jgi:hypothetical protein
VELLRFANGTFSAATGRRLNHPTGPRFRRNPASLA